LKLVDFRNFIQSRGIAPLEKEDPIMRRIKIVAVLLSAIVATPALARDGSPYVGIDAGVTKAQSLDLTFTNAAVTVPNGERLKHKSGYDLDGVVGYDFGMFRLEGELAYKHSKTKRASLDSAALAAVLLPPAGSDLNASGHGNVLTGMLNALVDFGPGEGLNGSIGAGIGAARARYNAGFTPSNALNFSGSANALAYQALAEIRAPVTSSVDLGLKARYFETSRLKFGPFCQTTCTTALPYRLSGRYKAFSLLGSVLFNFGVAAPPPSPPPPPPAPPPPATQTCPDGSVIAATSSCPAPPPPAPPPPPPTERGERGE
jgi:opacity protein-like surface antigen